MERSLCIFRWFRVSVIQFSRSYWLLKEKASDIYFAYRNNGIPIHLIDLLFLFMALAWGFFNTTGFFPTFSSPSPTDQF